MVGVPVSAGVASKRDGGLDSAHAGAKSHQSVFRASTPTSERDRIAILQELPLLITTELDEFLSSFGNLQHAAFHTWFWATDRARTQQVAHLHVAPRYGVVCEHLLEGEEEVLSIGFRDRGGVAGWRWSSC